MRERKQKAIRARKIRLVISTNEHAPPPPRRSTVDITQDAPLLFSQSLNNGKIALSENLPGIIFLSQSLDRELSLADP